MINRREFMRRMALGIGALGLAGCGSSTETTPNISGGQNSPIQDFYDVAIIGGGVSGLYSGYRLLQQENEGRTAPLSNLIGDSSPLRLALFEGSQRIGGRLYSIPTPEMPNLETEIGGMRLLLTQPLVNGLVDRLGMPTKTFPPTGTQNIFYTRDTRYRVGDVVAANPVIPYTLGGTEQMKMPFSLMIDMVLSIIPNALTIQRSEWNAVKQAATYQGRPLHEFGVRDVLRDFLTPEAFSFVNDGLGYSSFLDNFNCADQFQNMSLAFPPNPSYRSPVGGMQAIPLRLADELVQRGGQLFMGRSLLRISRDAEDFVLQFTSGEVTRAKVVVLGMPPASIQRLSDDSLPLTDSRFLTNLGAVTPQPSSRLFMAFREPWWESLGPQTGFGFTDLPMRMCFYFGVEENQAGGQPGNRNSLILATFNDAGATSFWEKFLDNPPMGGTSDPFTTQGVAPDIQAPRLLVQEAVRQLGVMHGITVPQPYWAAYISWSTPPFGGGWHFWRPGQKSWEVQPQVRRPLDQLPLFVCGEAFSSVQGWIEGALETAEDILTTELGLTLPPAPPTPVSGPTDIALPL